MTSLGTSIVALEVVEAITKVLSQFVEIGDLHRRASTAIAELTGAEAGFVTASCSAAISLAVAAAITGDNLWAIEQLPDTESLKNDVLIQAGHMVSYGAPVEQAIRMAGGKVVPVGQSTSAHAYQLAGAINERPVAAVFVVSRHVVDYGQIPLKTFAEACHASGVKVIVDAASEYDLRRLLADGANVVLYSGHKFLGGPTSGIWAGGKEGIAGVIAALETWKVRDHDGIRARERKALALWVETLDGRPGVTAGIVPDPTDNPLDRLKVDIDPETTRITAWDLARALARGDHPIIVRDHEAENGHFFLDPCNLHPDEEAIVAGRLIEELDRAQRSNEVIFTPLPERWLAQEAAILNWP
ncbi:MAG: PLP-dependent transferase [Candidatus Devosia euplotis]|nr:PLP-dependent transferase [Candidatus Devosia euplotis]